MATFPFPDRISQSSSNQYNQNVNISTYGDGAEQRVAMGLNSFNNTWSVTLENLSLTERNTFVTFWKSVGLVVSFDWTPPNGEATKWVFSEGPVETNHGIVYSFSMTLRQVFA